MSNYAYKMIIAYEGTKYGGWQVQPNAVSIQSLIEKTLSLILRQEVDIIGSGRTDAGVHALAQVAHFLVHSPIDLNKTLASLNGILPLDIRILALAPVANDFHARYSATSKIYHYHLHLDPVPDPLSRRYTYHVPHPVSPNTLKQAAAQLLGTHDFTSFANKAMEAPVKNGISTLYRLDVVEEAHGVRLEFEGNGFLYKMVRNIVGTLLDICAGKIAVDSLPHILAAKDRKSAGRAAPPHGLFLVEVKYASE